MYYIITFFYCSVYDFFSLKLALDFEFLREPKPEKIRVLFIGSDEMGPSSSNGRVGIIFNRFKQDKKT